MSAVRCAFVRRTFVRCALVAATAALAASSSARAREATVRDVGIFSDLDEGVRITLPIRIDAPRAWLRLDEPHHLVVLYEGEIPLKAYPLVGPPPAGPAAVAKVLARLDPAQAAELSRRVLDGTAVTSTGTARHPGPVDSDGDGIPDPLDISMGARKLVLNHARYTEGYVRLPYPNGDIPRGMGVCSDTIVRAFRNAGVDLQQRIAEDIRAAPAAYPWIRRSDPSIDHRRVRTLLTWFIRHAPQVHDGPGHAGDVVFLDTFPDRPGPDHVGIISDRTAPSGQPFVINNWTVGYEEGEMDLLPAIPVTHRFRMK